MFLLHGLLVLLVVGIKAEMWRWCVDFSISLSGCELANSPMVYTIGDNPIARRVMDF